MFHAKPNKFQTNSNLSRTKQNLIQTLQSLVDTLNYPNNPPNNPPSNNPTQVNLTPKYMLPSNPGASNSISYSPNTKPIWQSNIPPTVYEYPIPNNALPDMPQIIPNWINSQQNSVQSEPNQPVNIPTVAQTSPNRPEMIPNPSNLYQTISKQHQSALNQLKNQLLQSHRTLNSSLIHSQPLSQVLNAQGWKQKNLETSPELSSHLKLSKNLNLGRVQGHSSSPEDELNPFYSRFNQDLQNRDQEDELNQSYSRLNQDLQIMVQEDDLNPSYSKLNQDLQIRVQEDDVNPSYSKLNQDLQIRVQEDELNPSYSRINQELQSMVQKDEVNSSYSRLNQDNLDRVELTASRSLGLHTPKQVLTEINYNFSSHRTFTILHILRIYKRK